MNSEPWNVMKTHRSCSLTIFRPLCRITQRRPGPASIPPLVLATAAVALLLLGGCSTHDPAGVVAGGASPLADDLRFQLGTVALAPDAKPAQFSFGKAKGQRGYAADWAGTAAGNMLSTSTSEPLLDLPVGVGTFALAPVVAVSGAIGARKHLRPDQLAECETNLVKAMSEMAVQRRFHEWLLKAASEKCQGRLVPLEQMQRPGSELHSPDSVLEARVEELRLERTGSGDTSYVLRIKVLTRLVRMADGAVLCEQPVEYRSGKCLFRDWTLKDAFQSVADTGYQELAEHIVGQLVTIDSRPLLAGAGYGKASARNRSGMPSFTGSKAPVNTLPLNSVGTRSAASDSFPAKSLSRQFVSYPMSDTESLEIHATADVTHVAFQSPLTREEADSEALREVKWDLDGLDEHPNMLVAVPASLAVIPVSLWKQGVALVRGVSAGKVQAAEAKLSEAAKRVQPHQALALQVAQQLAPHTSQPVMLVKEPLGSGTGTDGALRQPASRGTTDRLPGDLTAVRYPASQPPGTVLQIHVQQAALTGPEGVNPKLAFCVEAQATLLRSCDGRQLCSWPVKYRSERRTFTTWAANDARLFQAEQQKCWRELGTTIADQMVARGLVPPDRKPQPTFAKQ